jgi:molybdenum cofactor cytidylyltransferase
MTESTTGPVEPPFGPGESPRVAGIVLAAGTSSRFGAQNKLLATLDGKAVVRRAVESVCEVLSDVVVVLGYEAAAVRSAVEDCPVSFVENGAYAAGQASSVRCGIEAVEPSVDGALFALGDMPDVRPSTIDLLVDAFGAGTGDPVVAAFEGQRGNPVVFGRQYFQRLATTSGDTGGRTIIESAPDTALVATGDPGVRRDIDTRADL